MHDCGDNLDRRGPSSDNADAFTGDRFMVVPLSAVKAYSFKLVDSIDLRKARIMENSAGADDDVCDQNVIIVGAQKPLTRLEVRFYNRRVEPTFDRRLCFS